MPDLLIATDAAWLDNELRSVLAEPNTAIRSVRKGADVLGALKGHLADLVILDLQIGNMGGFAVAIDLHLEVSGGRAPNVPIVLLLDREADHFLAKRADVDAGLVKPIDAGTLRRTVKRVLAERTSA